MSKFYRIILLIFLLFLPSILHGKPLIIAKASAVFDIEQDKDILFSINNYLSRFSQLSVTEENRVAAEDFLKSLYFVSKAHCHYVGKQEKNLICNIKTKKIIHDIIIKDLPASLLESELKNKLPIQVGHLIDIENNIKETLALVKMRVETFLRKNGYYGSTVDVTKILGNSSLINIIVKINDGAFARVNKITIHGDSPISAKAIEKLYKRMCFRFDRIIESFSIGTLSCYSRELERETTESLQERFAKMGYVQALIRISHHWVDPNDVTEPKSCQKRLENDLVSRCVNLRIDIEKGPKVHWTIQVKDRMAISRNAFLRFIGSIFSVDLFSRATVSESSDEVPLDHMIIKQELLDKVTFITAKNVDEREITESATEIANFLISKGFANAEVIPHTFQKDPENLEIIFDVYAGKPYFISSVRLLPEKYLSFIKKEDLETLIGIRSITNNGHLSLNEIDSARQEIENRLKALGFQNIKINMDIESIDNGGVRVTYYIESSQREVIDQIIVVNGYPELNEVVLPLLNNCDNHSRHKASKLCYKSSLVRDKLEADSQRIEDFYKDHGFFYAKVKSEVTKDTLGYKVIFTIYDSRYKQSLLVPLKKQQIKAIIISGNNTTSTSAIKRLFPKERKSHITEPIDLKKGLAKLRETGNFSRIEHKIMAGEENSDDLYFLLQLSERPSLSIDTSIAFSTDKLFSFETELEETNLFSSMLRLNTSLQLGLFWGRQSIFNNKLTWPFILGKPLRFIINAPVIVYDDFSHRPEPSRRLQSKVSFSLEWRFSKRIMPYIRYWLVFNQVDKSPPPTNFYERLKSLDGLIGTIRAPLGQLVGVLKPGISYIQLDNPFDPRLGVDMNWWTEFSGWPFKETVSFINLGIQNRFFMPLGPLTLALQATLMRAFITPNKDNWEKLRNASSAMDSLGGDRSIRGYQEAVIGIYQPKGSPGFYGGYFSNTANFELRFPITTKSSFGNFSGALFVDQGMLVPCTSLFGCFTDMSINSMVKDRGFGLSLGAALRYILPVGPISLDYGISPFPPWDNRVHILFGYSF